MENNQKYISQFSLTVLTEIKSKAATKELTDLLYEINKSYTNNPHVNFSKFKLLHYARWFVIDQAEEVDGTPVPPMLAFTSNFDLGVDEHLDELIALGAATFEKVYSYCKGFPAGKGKEAIKKYLLDHSKKNQLFWPAIRGGTVEQIRGEANLRDRIETYIDQEQNSGNLTGKSPTQIRDAVKQHIGQDADLNWATTPRAKPTFSWYLSYWWLGIRTGLVLLLLMFLPLLMGVPVWACPPLFLVAFAVFILLWVFVISKPYAKKDDREREEIKRSKDLEKLLRNEDTIFQNQLTIYGAVKKPYWYRLTTLKLGLLVFSINGTYNSNKGKLSGIETIHFARWSLFNRGRNVMFLSNYDGAWEMYLSEFIDRSAMAMNLTFGTTANYPRTKNLLWEGAFDEQAFKTVVRNNQYPCPMWWSAYPYTTVKNILNNNMIRKGLDGSSEESAEQWIARI